MESTSAYQHPPADSALVDQIVNQIKSAGTFDQWRRECLADVDTKPAYQNLTFRVDNAVASFLSRQRWRPDMAKNQVRENLRRHILDLGIIEKGVDRIVEQVVQPKVLPVFHPAVEDAIYTFLGIERVQKKENKGNNNHSSHSTEVEHTSSPNKRTFKPMPVSMTGRETEPGATPPPGEEEFELEAVSPSSRSESRVCSRGGLAVDEVSDVSMEDASQPPGEDLGRICSPVSQSSSSRPPGEDRAVSALSVISSGEDLPSSTSSPVPSAEPVAAEDLERHSAAPSPEAVERPESAISSSRRDSDEEDDDDDSFSSPEFEKLDINAPTSRAATPVKTDEEDMENEKEKVEEAEQDDHVDWRPKSDNGDPDRKPDEDPTAGPTQSAEPRPPPPSQPPPTSNSDSIPNSSEKTSENKTGDRPKSAGGSSKDKDTHRSRSKHESSSHKSSRKDKEKDRERDRERDRDRDREKERNRDRDKDREKERDRDRDRDREKERKRREKESSDKRSSSSKHHHRSDRRRSKDREHGEKKKSSSHRSSDRGSERRDKSESDRHRSSNKKKEKPPRSPSPLSHPKAHLWKRPAEKPVALWEYLARFPAEVFEDGDNYDGNLSDVSISSVSSYWPSETESTIVLRLSEVEVDSDLEETLIRTGGRIVYLDSAEAAAASEPVPVVEVASHTSAGSSYVDPVTELAGAGESSVGGGHQKRVRKVNTRYSDSYVGSEFRKIITQHSSDHIRPSSPSATGHLNNNVKQHRRSAEDVSLSESSSPEEPRELVDEDEEYPAPDAKRLKNEVLPSSPESVQSDPSNVPLLPPTSSPTITVPAAPSGDEQQHIISPTSRRRSAALKQPQQRYDDADLYKPRPVITPSSRRSRRPEDS